MAKILRIALDIDGTLTEHYRFFSKLTNNLPNAKFYIITGRGEEFSKSTKAELKRRCIKYEELYHIDPTDWSAKGKACEKLRIDIFFEDQDEYIGNVPESVLVFKVRNDANFDFEEGRWLI